MKHRHEFRGKVGRGASGNFAHDLMAGDKSWPTLCKFAFDDVKVSSADAAGANP
jgi:hypothetical protein